MNYGDTNSLGAIVAQGSVTAAAALFLGEAIKLMTPFLILATILIFVDLFFGVPAARIRKDKVTFSRALRKTVNKVMEYICWIVLSSSLAVAFDFPALNWIILAVVMGNELISIIENYALIKGFKITGLHKYLIKWFGAKTNTDTSDIEIRPAKPKK